jgi:hypothetical protein
METQSDNIVRKSFCKSAKASRSKHEITLDETVGMIKLIATRSHNIFLKKCLSNPAVKVLSDQPIRVVSYRRGSRIHKREL